MSNLRGLSVGILTFHRSLNTGAFIQCYALQKQLQNDFPEIHFEIIDYATSRVKANYTDDLFTFLFSYLSRTKYGIGKINPLKKFLYRMAVLIKHPNLLRKRRLEQHIFDNEMKMLNLSKKALVSDECDVFNEFIYGKYDIVVVGSDCVWQYHNYPFPSPYFLHDDIGAKKLSYAACAYKIDLDEMDYADKKYIKESLKTYEFIGIRDGSTKELLMNLGIDVPFAHNCDPTFLLDLGKIPIDLVELRKKLERHGVDFSKKIIGIQSSLDSIGYAIKKINITDVQLVAIRDDNKYADVYIDDLTPLEWSRVFSFFDVSVTTYFHGTLLSLLNGTKVISFNSELSYADRKQTRLYDVLSRLNMLDNLYIMKELNDVDHAWLERKIYDALYEKAEYNVDKIIELEKLSYMEFKMAFQKTVDELNVSGAK